MRFSIFGYVLVLAAVFAIPIKGLSNGPDFGSDFEKELISVGSEVESIGKPKLKISEHPDGYSIQAGLKGYYMRLRFTNVDNSIDFNILDHKGSVKYTRHSGDDFEGEFQLEQINTHPGCSFDATVKVRYKRVETGRYGSPLDPIDIQFSLTDPTGYTSGLLSGHACKIWIDRYRIIDPNIEATATLFVNPKNWAESKIDVDWKYLGKSELQNENNGKWEVKGESVYSLSTTLKINDLVESSPSERQPKISMEFSNEVSHSINNKPSQFRGDKSKCTIDGMINLTGKGERLGVAKFNCTWDNAAGRVQARRVDTENLRFEIFNGGREVGALNVYQNTKGATNVTVEAPRKQACDGSKKATYRFYEILVQDSPSLSYEQRLYKDFFYHDSHYSHRCRMTEGDRGLVVEEKLSANKGKYLHNVMFSDGTNNKNLYSSLENLMASTKIQVGVMAKRWDYTHKTYALQNDDKISLDIKDKLDEPKEYDMKVSYNNDRIFDGWFYLTSIIRRYAREQIPAFIEHGLAELKKQNMEFTSILSKYL